MERRTHHQFMRDICASLGDEWRLAQKSIAVRWDGRWLAQTVACQKSNFGNRCILEPSVLVLAKPEEFYVVHIGARLCQERKEFWFDPGEPDAVARNWAALCSQSWLPVRSQLSIERSIQAVIEHRRDLEKDPHKAWAAGIVCGLAGRLTEARGWLRRSHSKFEATKKSWARSGTPIPRWMYSAMAAVDEASEAASTQQDFERLCETNARHTIDALGLRRIFRTRVRAKK